MWLSLSLNNLDFSSFYHLEFLDIIGTTSRFSPFPVLTMSLRQIRASLLVIQVPSVGPGSKSH